MTGLMLGRGTKRIKLDQLRGLETPPPERYWAAAPHATMVDLVKRSVAHRGYEVRTEEYGISHDETSLFGVIELANREVVRGREYNLMIGLINCNNKRRSWTLSAGAKVAVCSNLSTWADLVIMRRHTINIMAHLPELIDGAMNRLQFAEAEQDYCISRYRRTELPDVQFHDLLIRSVDAGVLPVTKIGAVRDHWRTPPHEEFEARNVWSAFNGFTHAFKGSNVFALPKKSFALHRICDETCDRAA